MNTITNIRQALGVWLVKVMTPGGTPLLVNCTGTLREAIFKAERAGLIIAAAPENRALLESGNHA